MDSTNAYIYGPSGTPMEQVNLTTGTVTYLIADELGSVRGALSSNGILNGSTAYDAYGNPETTGGLSAFTPFGFAGGYTDATGARRSGQPLFRPADGTVLERGPDRELDCNPLLVRRATTP